MNKRERLYDNIPVDGQIGKKTLDALSKVGSGNLLFKVMNILQGEHYINLMRRNETFEKYIGWFNRIELK